MTQIPKHAPRAITKGQTLGAAQPDVFVPLPKKPDDPATTQPASEFFKDSPDSHASCFTCHYQRVKPAAKPKPKDAYTPPAGTGSTLEAPAQGPEAPKAQ